MDEISLKNMIDRIIDFAESFLKLHSINFRFAEDTELPDSKLKPEAAENIFIAAREAIEDIVNNSGASEMGLNAGIKEGTFYLVIKENGHGNSSMSGTYDGLKNIKSRIALINGDIFIHHEPGIGSSIMIMVPEERLLKEMRNST